MAPKRGSTVRLPWQQPVTPSPTTAPPTPVIAEVDALLVHVFALVGEGIAGATHSLLAGDREAARAAGVSHTIVAKWRRTWIAEQSSGAEQSGADMMLEAVE